MMMFLESMRLAARLPLAPTYLTSDKVRYVTHGLALRNEMRTWCGVEKGAVTKNECFLYTLNV
jgi:hypothetical protein